MLAYFDPDRELKLGCVASPYDIGAVLYDCIDGEQQLIGFRPRKLTAAETNYSPIELEVLASVFRVTRFGEYLRGRESVIAIDHQTVLGLIRPDRQTPAMLRQEFKRVRFFWARVSPVIQAL